MIDQENGDITICCPFHHDSTPSCSVSPKKRCFHCFGCKEKGTLTHLAMKLQGVSKGEAIQHRAATAQLDVEYHDPDSKAEAKYSYEDSQGRLLKPVLRYPDKKFVQRQPTPNGWVYDTKGVRPTLYNLPRLEFARTVVITEGEKDADRVTSLKLLDATRSEMVATTSGSSDSWLDKLANALIGKRVDCHARFRRCWSEIQGKSCGLVGEERDSALRRHVRRIQRCVRVPRRSSYEDGTSAANRRRVGKHGWTGRCALPPTVLRSHSDLMVGFLRPHSAHLWVRPADRGLSKRTVTNAVSGLALPFRIPPRLGRVVSCTLCNLPA